MSGEAWNRTLKWLAAALGAAALVLMLAGHLQHWSPQRETAITGPLVLLAILATLIRVRRKPEESAHGPR